MKILHVNKKMANTKYVYYSMGGIKFNSSIHKRYWISEYSKIKIPLPPLNIQEELDIFVRQKKDILTNGVAYNALTIVKLKQIKVPLPSLLVQQKIVSKIDKEISIIEQNKRLVGIFEQKIKDKISEVWGE